jgi:hypothetical protein
MNFFGIPVRKPCSGAVISKQLVIEDDNGDAPYERV